MKYLSDLSKKQKTAIKRWTAVFLAVVLCATSIITQHSAVQASSYYSFLILSKYNCTLNIGQSFYLVGIASNGKRITWKSSKSSIASVNTYGCVTAKKAGTCKITGKVSGGEASCTVTVRKTTIHLSAATMTMENRATALIRGTTSNGAPLVWQSKKRSVATINENGKITAHKPGETTIIASANGSSAFCKLTVRKPKITLNKTSASLYRGNIWQLTAKTSSGQKVMWKSNKSSVATVSESGKVTAKKHGIAHITAKLDGVTKECVITVKSPMIKLSHTSVTLKKGKTRKLHAYVSSGNKPLWKSSKSSVATVDQTGKIKANKKGKCFIYASEDGTKVSCHVQVTA